MFSTCGNPGLPTVWLGGDAKPPKLIGLEAPNAGAAVLVTGVETVNGNMYNLIY